MNVVGKNTTAKQECNNDNIQRLVPVFVDETKIHATQTEPYLRWLGSSFSTHVQGNQFLTWKS